MRRLPGAPALLSLQRPLHRAGDAVGVQDRCPAEVACGAPHGLDERAIGAQEPLLIGVENRDERYLGEVEALAQQVDPDQHVELAEPQAPNDLDALDRVDFGVQVAHADPVLLQVVGEVLVTTLTKRMAEDLTDYL